MEKILFLIITLLFSSLATAENEAVYNEAEGSIEIPVLSVKGQTEKYSVTLQQEDAEDLIFTITDATPDPEVESSTNEATYDPETGVVIIPSVMVLEEGKSAVKSYSVELQLTEESIFKISQVEPILALPTNAFNGIPSETLSFSVSAQTAPSRCSGNPSQNLATARQNFQTKCGEPWNDQKHVCDYKPDGFHCNGNVSASTTPAPSNPTTSNPTASGSSRCTGNPSQNLATARQNFQTKCGEPWNDQKHVCDYKAADGFRCSGDVSASTTPDPTNPPTSNPPATNPDWCTGTSDRNRDVAKRNFRDACGQPWNDQLGHICESKSNGWHCSGTTDLAVVLNAPTSVKATRLHPHVVFIDWATSGLIVAGYDIYRSGNKIASISSISDGHLLQTYSYVDKNATGNSTYQIVAFSDRTRSPSSNVADLSHQHNRGTQTSSVTHFIHDPDTGEHTRTFEGTFTTTPNGITSEGDIFDTRGVHLGTLQMEYNANGVEATADPVFGASPGDSITVVVPFNSIAFENMAGTLPVLMLDDKEVINLFPGLPVRPFTAPGGGGGGDDDTDTDTDTGEDTSGEEDLTPDTHPGTGPGNDPEADGN